MQHLTPGSSTIHQTGLCLAGGPSQLDCWLLLIFPSHSRNNHKTGLAELGHLVKAFKAYRCGNFSFFVVVKLLVSFQSDLKFYFGFGGLLSSRGAGEETPPAGGGNHGAPSQGDTGACRCTGGQGQGDRESNTGFYPKVE